MPSLFTLSEKIMSLISTLDSEKAPDFHRGIVAGLRIAHGMAEMYECLQAQPIIIRASETEEVSDD